MNQYIILDEIRVRCSIPIVLMLYFAQAFAQPANLLSCFADAADNDPVYQAQVAIYMASQQALPENVSAVLPQVTLSGAIAREYEMMGQLGGGTFNTNSYSLQANQTVFNYTQFRQIKQAKYSVKQAFATLSAQQQDLIIRTAQGYFDVLKAHDLLNFAKQQKQYILKQLTATKKLFQHHDATITDLEQAQGANELIDAELYAAQINLYDAIQTLGQTTGVVYQDFTYLNNHFVLVKPNPDNLDTWLQTANTQNWYLCAARLGVNVGREALKAIQGNFLPTLTATGGFTRATVPSLLLVDSVPNNSNIVGLNANWNIFQGGLTIAQVKAATANLQQSEANMRQQYLQTMADTRRAYNNILVGVSRVKSARASLVANTKALNHAQEAYQAGEITITEILQIQFQLHRAQTLYTEYVYNYLMNTLLLKQAAGTLTVGSLIQLNCWLNHPKQDKHQPERIRGNHKKLRNQV